MSQQKTLNQPKGMPCPKCGTPIAVSLKDLLEAKIIVCPGCGLHLEVDRASSSKSLEALQRLNVAIENLNAVSKQSY